LRYDYQQPANQYNDRFILSKGHAVPVFYAALKQIGLVSEQELLSLRKFDSMLEGHPTPRFAFNEAATGSLGQGLSVGLGMAINAQRKSLGYRTYVVLGDGECAEGSVWEAAALAGNDAIPDLIAIVDANRLAQAGTSLDAHEFTRYEAKWAAFGWRVLTIDGHSMVQILGALVEAAAHRQGPVVIIAKTFKGYGAHTMQDKPGFHGKAFKPSEATEIIEQLNAQFPQAHAYTGGMPVPQKPSAVQVKQPTAFAGVHIDALQTAVPLGKSIATRKAFGLALAQLTKDHSDVWTVDADVKNSTYTEFAEVVVPERFIQCYIAEQNMIGVATGLALRGNRPFAATFAAFFSRCFDQIRMAAIGRVPLRLCGSHSGVSIGQDGPSQMGLEDISMLRAVPGSVVLYPSDGVSAYKMVYLMAGYDAGVSYMKTTRAETPVLYDYDEQFPLGGCKVLRSSAADTLLVVAAGITVHEALVAADKLAAEGIAVAVIDAYSIKPLDAATITATARKAGGRVLTVEDHYIQGGLGEAVAAACGPEGLAVHILGVTQVMRSAAPEELLAYAQIDAAAIIAKVHSLR
jgi:transketolase